MYRHISRRAIFVGLPAMVMSLMAQPAAGIQPRAVFLGDSISDIHATCCGVPQGQFIGWLCTRFGWATANLGTSGSGGILIPEIGVDGAITGATITYPGRSYTLPTTDGNASGTRIDVVNRYYADLGRFAPGGDAVVRPVVKAGQVTGVTVLNGGSGYSTALRPGFQLYDWSDRDSDGLRTTAAIGGNTVQPVQPEAAVLTLQRRVLAFNPNVVIINLGTSDYFNEGWSALGTTASSTGFHASYRRLLAVHAAQGPAPRVICVGLQPYLATQRPYALAPYQAAIAESAREFGFSYVSLDGMTLTQHNNGDTIHPNVEGQAFIAGRIAAAVQFEVGGTGTLEPESANKSEVRPLPASR